MKRYNITLILLFVAVMSFQASDVMAQENKRVEVTSYYIPELSAATKLNVPTEIDDVPYMEPEIIYDVEPKTWHIGLNPYTFRHAEADFNSLNRAKHMYMVLGTGYPLQSVAQVSYLTQHRHFGYFGVGLDHAGDYAQRYSADNVKRTISDSYNMQNGASLMGGIVMGKRMLEANVDYSFDLYNAYAEAAENPSLNKFHSVGGSLCFGDSFANLERLNFSVEAHADYWTHPMADGAVCESAYNAGGLVRAARDFDRNIVGLNFAYDLWSQGENGDYRNSRFSIAGDYARKFGIVDIEAGIGYMFDKVMKRDKPSHFIMPRVKVLVDLQKAAFVPYAELNTTVSQNGVVSLFEQNPYVDLANSDVRASVDRMPNTRSYNLSIGFSGAAFANRLSYRAFAGVSFMRNHLYWYVTRAGWFGVDSADNTRLMFGVEAQYKPIGGLDISLGYYMHGNNNESLYVDSESKMRGNIKLSYTHKSWKIYVKADLLGRREWSCAYLTSEPGKSGSTSVFVMPATIDLGAGVSFRASKSVEIYVDGYNLLNKQIFDAAYYYRPGIGFNAGVRISFL